MAFDAANTASAVRTVRVYRCDECKTECPLHDLNDDMLCMWCAGVEVDEDSIIDTSPAAMLREHGTWRL